jgi:hypothetical protein
MSEIDLRHRRARPSGEQRGDEGETRFVHCFVRQDWRIGPKAEECPISEPGAPALRRILRSITRPEALCAAVPRF